jgi:hypothetical protein
MGADAALSPPLLIPWHAIQTCVPKSLGWHEGVTVSLGTGEGFWTPGKAAKAIGEAG